MTYNFSLNMYPINLQALKETFAALNDEYYDTILLFLDRDGSMTAFEYLVDMIDEAASSTKLNVHRYYYYNIIQNYIYKNKAHTEYTTIDDVVNSLKNNKVLIIFLSDEGAARGTNTTYRVRANIRLFHKLSEIKINYQLWLNPFPTERWENTSAKRTSKFVPMCECTVPNILRAISNSITYLNGNND